MKKALLITTCLVSVVSLAVSANTNAAPAAYCVAKPFGQRVLITLNNGKPVQTSKKDQQEWANLSGKVFNSSSGSYDPGTHTFDYRMTLPASSVNAKINFKRILRSGESTSVTVPLQFNNNQSVYEYCGFNPKGGAGPHRVKVGCASFWKAHPLVNPGDKKYDGAFVASYTPDVKSPFPVKIKVSFTYSEEMLSTDGRTVVGHLAMVTPYVFTQNCKK